MKRAGCRWRLCNAQSAKGQGRTGLSFKSWQEWQGSNLRPPVLETGALPIELHSYGGPASPPIRAVSSIGRARKASVKRRVAKEAADRLLAPACPPSGPAQQ